jgi:tripartite motif-containing protein 71
MSETATVQSRLGLSKSRLDEARKRFRKKLLLFTAVLVLFLALSLLLVFRYLPTQRQKQALPMLPVFSINELDRPLSVSVDDNGRIYVSDTGNRKLAVYDRDGRYLGRIGRGRTGERFDGLFGVRTDAKGRVYVSDWKRRSIEVFSADGQLERRFPANPMADLFGERGFSPYGIDFYKGKLYVAGNDGVYVFSGQGKLLEKFGSPGSDMGEFNYPSAVVVDPKDGSFYVTDQLNHRLVAMSPTGSVKWVIGRKNSKGKSVSIFSLPRGLALDSEGRLYVGDTFFHRIVVLSTEGELISVMGQRGTDEASFNFPEGLALDGEGRLLVADRENNRVQVLKIQGLPEPAPELIDQHKKSLVKAAG